MAFKLVYRTAEGRQERPLKGPRVTIGRDPGNDVVIPDEAARGLHTVGDIVAKLEGLAPGATAPAS